MSDGNQRGFAETLFEGTQRREAEINEALKQEGSEYVSAPGAAFGAGLQKQ